MKKRLVAAFGLLGLASGFLCAQTSSTLNVNAQSAPDISSS